MEAIHLVKYNATEIRRFEAPDMRAKVIYSAWHSICTRPLVIRAYSAHFVMHKEMITFVMLGPIIPMKAMAITMSETLVPINQARYQRSMLGVENPANPPIAIPMAPLMPMMVKAIPKEALPPYKNTRPHITTELVST